MLATLILPVPLSQTFTYRIPDRWVDVACVGMRATVPFGRNHVYTGIIVSIVPDTPESLQSDSDRAIQLREILDLPDARPILRHQQLRLWQWMSDYYLAPIGDVMKAALPAELKPEEGSKGVVRQDFKPRMRTFVRINADLTTNSQDKSLQQAFDQLSRSPRQQTLFMTLLDRSRALHQKEPLDVPQDELLQACGASTEQLRQLQLKNLCTTLQKPVSRLDATQFDTAPLEPLHPLTQMQQVAYRDICQSWSTHQVCLLHGVTSSGKTEIYMHLMNEVMSQGRQVLMMVPEIALTTQLCQRLRRVFGSRMLVYHSKLSDAERVEIWHAMLSDDKAPQLVLGVRSSIFLPFHQLGLVVVDEEHEPSYKQQDPSPRYHGRDTALILARHHSARVLLGSATPSLESFYLAQQDKYGLVRLTERHAGISMPRITLVSMSEARKKPGGVTGPFSSRLIATLNHTLAAGRQAILFQNRRGFSPVVFCTSCGWSPCCPRCDVSLNYHRHTRQLSCHYCGNTMPWPARCPQCGNTHLELQGYGTERIEDTLCQLLPVARPARMDTDTTSTRRSYERIISDFEHLKTNVLIGTQMVSKGLDFSAVDVVGVLNADALINFPDFRAHERAFQLMEQVAGRAGRRVGQEGEVLIQCSDPNHRLLRQVLHHDYLSMAATELADRQKYGYPPYTRFISLYIKGRYEDRTRQLAQSYADQLRLTFGQRVLGPEAPGISRIRNFYIQQIVLKIERDASIPLVRQYLRTIHAQMLQTHEELHKTIFYYDVDPM